MQQSVKYLYHYGSDEQIAKIARNATGSDNTEVERFINFLIRKEHLQPFEFGGIVFQIECPLYIRSQFMRHRTFSYCELSRRYNSENIEFYDYEWKIGKFQCVDDAKKNYEFLIETEVSSEDARAILPQCTMTKFIVRCDIRNLMHFLKLRLDKHAQREIRQIARRMFEMFEELFPFTAKAFSNYILNAVTFSKTEMIWIKEFFSMYCDRNTTLDLYDDTNFTKNELDEFLNKLK